VYLSADIEDVEKHMPGFLRVSLAHLIFTEMFQCVCVFIHNIFGKFFSYLIVCFLYNSCNFVKLNRFSGIIILCARYFCYQLL